MTIIQVNSQNFQPWIIDLLDFFFSSFGQKRQLVLRRRNIHQNPALSNCPEIAQTLSGTSKIWMEGLDAQSFSSSNFFICVSTELGIDDKSGHEPDEMPGPHHCNDQLP